MKYVTYLRVSTQRQGTSGLGLEAQRANVRSFVTASDLILSEYVEVESGKNASRPELQRALAHAREANATLLIAKLDRLARNVAFIANLLEAGVDVAAADLPQANRFVLHIMSAVAEQEGKAISERTKHALAQAKLRGRKLGWSNPSRQDHGMANLRSQEARQAKSAAFAQQIGPKIAELRSAGASYGVIASELNALGIAAPRGTRWWPATARSTLTRYLALQGES